MKRVIFILIAMPVLFVGSAASQTGCVDEECRWPETVNPGDIGLFNFYRRLWGLDIYRARTQWNLSQTTPFEEKEECVAECRNNYFLYIALCESVHRSPDKGEAPEDAQSRLNCVDAIREQEIQCLSPPALLSCQSK